MSGNEVQWVTFEPEAAQIKRTVAEQSIAESHWWSFIVSKLPAALEPGVRLYPQRCNRLPVGAVKMSDENAKVNILFVCLGNICW